MTAPDLLSEARRLVPGLARPPQRRADCERWLAAWRTT
jgi:hypothetical protein